MTCLSGTLGAMPSLPFPLRFVLVALAGWMNQQQRAAIDYLQEENRALREQIGPRRLRFTDEQRRRLAAKAQTLGRHVLGVLSVTPHELSGPPLIPSVCRRIRRGGQIDEGQPTRTQGPGNGTRTTAVRG